MRTEMIYSDTSLVRENNDNNIIKKKRFPNGKPFLFYIKQLKILRSGYAHPNASATAWYTILPFTILRPNLNP